MPVKRARIEFKEAAEPISEMVTKFGGQPVWLEEPQWPISKKTQEPMMFICQISLDREIFGEIEGKMAYVFMTNDGAGMASTWDPDKGENAVIIQPGELLVPVQALTSGPTLYRMIKRPNEKLLSEQPCEFGVSLALADDPDFLPEETRWALDDDAGQAYDASVEGNKVAGTPGFIQNDEFPSDSYKRLLLQLDASLVPFSINFGDCGVGYAFLSDDGRSGKFLWQCS